MWPAASILCCVLALVGLPLGRAQHNAGDAYVSHHGHSNSASDVVIDQRTNVVYVAYLVEGVFEGVTPLNSMQVVSDEQCPRADRVAVNPDTGAVYVTCTGSPYGELSPSDSVLVAWIDGNVTTLATAAQCYIPYDVAVHPATGTVYVACNDRWDMSRSRVIAIRDGVVSTVASAAQCPFPRSVAVHSSTGVVYATCALPRPSDGPATIISIQGDNVEAFVAWEQCPDPKAVEVDSRTGVVYATCEGYYTYTSGVISIKGSSVTIIASEAQCVEPANLAIHPISGEVYVVCLGRGETPNAAVLAINGRSLTTLISGDQCIYPSRVAVSSSTGAVYVNCGRWPTSSVTAVNIDRRCNANAFFSTVAPAGCSACPADTFRNSSMAAANEYQFACAACPVASFAPAGSSECSPCPSGFFGTVAGGGCPPCAPGSYSANPTQTSCFACNPGQYQQAGGQTACVDSAEGHFVPSSNSSAQLPCSPGTFNPLTGQTSCAECPVGTFSSLGAQSAYPCTPCSAGRFSNVTALGDISGCQVRGPGGICRWLRMRSGAGEGHRASAS